MSSELPTWGVVSTMQEPPQLIAAFAAHYLSMGASLVAIFLDGPNPEAEALLGRTKGVFLQHADESHYRSNFNEPVPAHLHRKQRLNANLVYQAKAVDWVLHVDADEFVQTDDLTAELASTPDDVDTIRIANGERAFLSGDEPTSIFDGVLTYPLVNRARRIRLIRGEAALKFTDRGFFGHAFGKSITRTGRDLRLGLHEPKRSTAVNRIWSKQSTLVHFDGLTRFHWMLKLLRYADASMYDERQTKASDMPRKHQMQYILEEGDPVARAQVLHDTIRVLGPTRAGRMRAHAALKPITIDPVKSANSLFGEGAVDLSISAFDAYLAANSVQAARYLEAHVRERV